MVQSLARCRECGLPGKLAEGLEWGPGGLILLRGAKPLRLALLDQETAGSIQASLEERHTRDACLIAEVEAVREAAGRDHTGLKGRLSRYGAAKRKILESMEGDALLLGLGRIEVERFNPGEGGAVLLRRPFNLAITAAYVTGVLEDMDVRSYAMAIDTIGEMDFRLVLETGEQGDGDTQRISDGVKRRGASHPGGAGNMCERCGLPTHMADWRWDELHGSIQAGVDGRRVAMVPSCLFDAFERLDVAGGDVRTGVVGEAIYGATMKSLQAGSGDAYENGGLPPEVSGTEAMRERMSLRGWGAVVTTHFNGGEWRIEVANPVDDALIAGWLRAIYTVAMGREPGVEVSGGPRARRFELA
ncbi:MAG: hypothetical protein AB1384_02465 [Actinomycetota bacterium]